jgi:hypothetical protein
MSTQVFREARPKMGRKKGSRKTVMLRVYEENAELILQFAGERRMTAADFLEKFLLPCGEKAHRDYIVSESKKLKGES